MNNRNMIEPKNAKRGITYYLHYGFYGHGGTPVKLKGSYVEKGMKIFTFQDSKGQQYAHSPGDSLFTEDPRNETNS